MFDLSIFDSNTFDLNPEPTVVEVQPSAQRLVPGGEWQGIDRLREPRRPMI